LDKKPQAVNHRERQLTAIQHRVSDRIPIDAIAIENITQIGTHLCIAEGKVMERLGIDGRHIAITYEGEPASPEEAAISEWGTPDDNDYGTAHCYPLAAVSSVAEIERHCWPDPSRYRYAESARQARLLHPDYAVRGPYWLPLFCRVCSLMGMEETLVNQLANPVIFAATLENVFVRVEEICQRYVEACGDSLDIFYLGDDFASQKNLLFSPALWRRYLKPLYAKLFEIGELAGKPIWFHSCGNILSVLPDLIEIGVDIWETVQLHTLPISPERLKEEYGKHITFFGGVNIQRLPFVSPSEVALEVQHCIKALGRGGGYICGPDHHIKPDVPPENVIALFDAAVNFVP
jgi:uroporphyrinogen decarboxylase